MKELQSLDFPTPSSIDLTGEKAGNPERDNAAPNEDGVCEAIGSTVMEGAVEGFENEKPVGSDAEKRASEEGSGSEPESAWEEEEVVMDSAGPRRGKIVSWEPSMGGVTVTAPEGTRLKPRSVNFVRTGIFLENPERYALNVVGIGEGCSKNGTAVQGFEYDANDGTVIVQVQVDNRSNEWVIMGEQDEAFRFIFITNISIVHATSYSPIR